MRIVVKLKIIGITYFKTKQQLCSTYDCATKEVILAFILY